MASAIGVEATFGKTNSRCHYKTTFIVPKKCTSIALTSIRMEGGIDIELDVMRFRSNPSHVITNTMWFRYKSYINIDILH
jgi:hypothetical protein